MLLINAMSGLTMSLRGGGHLLFPGFEEKNIKLSILVNSEKHLPPTLIIKSF
jgi:hypothetical protein